MKAEQVWLDLVEAWEASLGGKSADANDEVSCRAGIV